MNAIESAVLQGLLTALIPTLKTILGNGSVSAEVLAIVTPIVTEIESLLGSSNTTSSS
jgi:hypothetical protein